MRFAVAATAAFVAGASASYYGTNATVSVPDVYTTEVVTRLTTVCPTPTEVTYGGKTYTVTESTTLTITDCPCTISYPVAPTQTPSHPVASPPVVPVPSGPAPVYPTNGTAPTVPVHPTGTSSPSGTPAPPAFTGAAAKMGAGVMAIAAAAAAFL